MSFSTKISQLLNNQNLMQTLDSLESRWQHESRYEDPNDYVEVIKKTVVNTGVVDQVLGAHVEPHFGFSCKIEGKVVKVNLAVDGDYLSMKAEYTA